MTSLLKPCHVILPDGKRVRARCFWLEDRQEYVVVIKTRDAGLDTPSVPEMELALKKQFVELDTEDGS